MPPERNPKSFQERLTELSDIVRALEGNELSLEESVARYEQGQRLHQELQAELAAYEQRLETLATPEATDEDDPSD